MIFAWVLIVSTGGYSPHYYTVSDIASQAACHRLEERIKQNDYASNQYLCVEYQKAKEESR